MEKEKLICTLSPSEVICLRNILSFDKDIDEIQIVRKGLQSEIVYGCGKARYNGSVFVERKL